MSLKTVSTGESFLHPCGLGCILTAPRRREIDPAPAMHLDQYLMLFCAFCLHNFTSAKSANTIGTCIRQLHQGLCTGFLGAKSAAHAKCSAQRKLQNANEAAHLALTVRVSRSKRLLTPAPLGPEVSYTQGAICIWCTRCSNTFSPEPYALLLTFPPLTLMLRLS